MSASADVVPGSPALKFYDDSSFIRVDNVSTGTSSYYPKAHVNFQRDSSTTFVLDTSSKRTTYLFADVALPVAATLKDLVEMLQGWVEASAANGDESGPFASDVTTTVLELTTHYNVQTLYVDHKGPTGFLASYDAGRNGVVMSISPSITFSSGLCHRQSKYYADVINNKTTTALVGALLISDTAVRNVVCRAGVYDDNGDLSSAPGGNGIFFQWRSGGEGLSLVMRSNITGAQVDVTVLQANWNLDALDGTGPSARVLDPTAENTFVFEWAPFGGHVIRAGILQESRPVWCHRFVNVRFGCPKVPFKWEIGRPDAASTDFDAASMIALPSSIMVRGRRESPSAIIRGFASPVAASITSASGPTSVLALKLAYNPNRSTVVPWRCSILNLDRGVAKWSLVRNVMLASSTWTTVANSYAFVSTVVTPATATPASSEMLRLASGYLEHGITTIDFKDDILSIFAGRVYTATDAWAIVVEYLRGVVTLSANIEWLEEE